VNTATQWDLSRLWLVWVIALIGLLVLALSLPRR
jgi:hypothetical protein